MSYNTIDYERDDLGRWRSHCWRCGYSAGGMINTCPTCSQVDSLERLAHNTDQPIFQNRGRIVGDAWSHETSMAMAYIVVYGALGYAVYLACEWFWGLFKGILS